MTASGTVILETPARKAAAPTIAKIPGELSRISWPIRRPKECASVKSWNDDSELDLATKRDGGEDQLDGGSIDEPAIVTALVLQSFLGADPRPFWISTIYQEMLDDYISNLAGQWV